MKKLFFTAATIALFLGACLFTFSTDSKGAVHVFNKAKANGLTWAMYLIKCPGNTGNGVVVCGPGPLTICQGFGSCDTQ